MTDEKEKVPQEDDVLQQSLKKLKVDPDWDSAFLGCKATEELCAGENNKMLEEKTSGRKKGKPQKDCRKVPSKSTKQRTQPYHKDNLPFCDGNLPSMDSLSFASEVCKSQTCTCNQQKDTSPAKQKDDKYPLNFAHASKYNSENGKLLQEPRLKLHHKEKDRRVVIRAARLRLAKQFKQPKPTFPSSVAPKKGGLQKDTVFGGSQSEKSSNFAALSTTDGGGVSGAPAPKTPAPVFDGKSFGSYRHLSGLPTTSMQQPVIAPSTSAASPASARSCSASADGLDMKALETSLPGSSISPPSAASKPRGEKRRPPAPPTCPVHPGRCSVPCSCSQQALMDPGGGMSVDELACYFDEFVHIPKKMSLMAEMMYT